jgi:two-component system, OmpR family, alkaline phosphatase synthesis response regulator PhoP
MNLQKTEIRGIMAKKILIVDDEPSITVPLKFLMEQNHFEVRVVHSGEEALATVDIFKPDLVLLDVMLPTADGFQVCQNLRENPRHKHLKVVFLSAMTRDLDIAKGNTLGADGYISKPFSNADVVRQVKNLLCG